ncbi:MAG TPA: glycosyltransferase [Bacteroidales bacterium]|nr:glycosyltransferase [Bacteroidales bacterium]
MNTKKNKIILAVSNDLVSDQRVHKVATSLCNFGYDVCVVGRKLPNSIALSPQIYQTKRLRLLFKKNVLFYAELNIRLFLYLLFSRADIYTANDLDTLLGVYCAARIRRKKIVYDSHEYFTEVPELTNNPKAKRIWELIESWIFPKLRNCMTVCNSIASIYQQKYGVPIAVVRNVPILSKPTLTPAQLPHIGQKHIILYQGAVNMGRGIECMIEAMNYINNAALVIIGGGDLLSQLTTTVSESAVASKVFFLGKIPFQKLPAYTQCATIGISLEEDLGLNYRYALPNKIFDYIHAHKPILVSDLPEMRTIIETYACGEICTDRNPQALAEQIQKLLNNTKALQTYSHNAALAAQELCWEQDEKVLLGVYHTDYATIRNF